MAVVPVEIPKGSNRWLIRIRWQFSPGKRWRKTKLIGIGDKLGLYKGLVAGGRQTAAELAKRTKTTERYVREWLCSQAAGGYVSYDAPSGKFYLSEEQAFALAAQFDVSIHGVLNIGLVRVKLTSIHWPAARC